MVAVCGKKNVAIECDGERWHSGEAKIREDMERQTILERLGWRFIRIRGSEYYSNPEKTMERVIAELTNYGIEPQRHGVDQTEGHSAYHHAHSTLADAALAHHRLTDQQGSQRNGDHAGADVDADRLLGLCQQAARERRQRIGSEQTGSYADTFQKVSPFMTFRTSRSSCFPMRSMHFPLSDSATEHRKISLMTSLI